MTKKVARTSVDQVSGVPIIGPGASSVTVNDKVISVINDTVTSHGDPPHVSPTINKGAPTITAEDKKITLTSISLATCGHPVATGSPNTLAL